MEEFGIIGLCLALILVPSCAANVITRDTVEQRARQCVTRYAAVTTAQDSLTVAADGCGWLLKPYEEGGR